MTLREEATLKVLKVVATLGKAISTGAIAAVGYYVPGIVGESFSLAHATRLLFFRGKTQKEESEFLLYSKKREKKRNWPSLWENRARKPYTCVSSESGMLLYFVVVVHEQQLHKWLRKVFVG